MVDTSHPLAPVESFPNESEHMWETPRKSSHRLRELRDFSSLASTLEAHSLVLRFVPSCLQLRLGIQLCAWSYLCCPGRDYAFQSSSAPPPLSFLFRPSP